MQYHTPVLSGGGETAAGRRHRWPMALDLRARRLLPGLTCVPVLYADRLMTAGDAAEWRRTRGPWTDRMVFGGAGHTAAGPRRQGGRAAGSFAVLFLI